MQKAKQIHPTAHVPIEFQIVRTVTKHLSVSPHGEKTIGQAIDRIIHEVTSEGEEIGKISLDLQEFSHTFLRRT